MTDIADIRVRVAPSPTGAPHVGTAYVALFNYAFARHENGQFLLRIEDTDRERSTRESEEEIMRALRWLGLHWDEGPDAGGPHTPYRQSERSDLYRSHAQTLLDTGDAYRCFCSPERLEELRERQKAEKGFVGYDGKCRDLDEEEIRQKLDAGEPYTIRMKSPQDGETAFQDRIRGEISVPNKEIDDQVLLKSDGFPTYHLANVVDDHRMGISHVVRAEEWISSTPKHKLLYEALGWDAPVFVHLPLLRNKDKTKISKRKNPTSLNWYREEGYLQEALLNFLALMGYSLEEDREMFTVEEMIEEFTWDRVKTSGPVFDREKLDWLNGEYIRELDPEELLGRILAEPYTEHTDENAQKMLEIVKLIQERIETLTEFDESVNFFFEREPYDPELLIPKKQEAEFALEIVRALKDTFQRVEQWETDTLEQLTADFCEEKDWKKGWVYMPLRIAITCRKVSTPLFETMEILGKEECLERLDLAVEKARSLV
ncbi:MAG: glutamate--tRNA ligase [Candidatus Brocadiia bacterium]